ncbi:hypothetical protein [Paracoccus sanguinis]|uniref:Peptidase n=1 Tax=Paracoccus sanguinis TaxID=1545044 RepID=A0A1H2SQP1_9RHOB|nr:hypothetical protein [Paracoccus sanguinis]KGJ19316.1 hypothetical protein IX57_00180 [Paracoccus sanguinis]SDW33956.1 hypothetical protein SAMN05444276_101699 [Paracoccus sanguinis]
MTTARIEVFRTGRFTPMQGAPLSFTAADLRAIADSYDPETAPAPIVVGHPATDAPAFGWVRAFEFDATADRLYADVAEMEPAFSEAVKAGRYKKVSLSFFRPEHSANPIPGTWYPKHVGFLGAAAPAVSGLRNVHFADDEDAAVTFTAEFGVGESTSRLLRGLREFLIEKFGLADADRALPAMSIEWLADEDEPRRGPAFAAPPNVPTQPVEEDDMTPPNDTPTAAPVTPPASDTPAFADREAAIAAREAAMAEREQAVRHADHVSFADGLVDGGRLLPASRDQVVQLLDDLAAVDAASFSADDANPAQRLRDILAAQPKVVHFGAAEIEDDATPAAAFSADGREVANADLHARALAWQAKHPDTPYLDAVKAVQA